MTEKTIVRIRKKPSEQQFHAAMIAGLMLKLQKIGPGNPQHSDLLDMEQLIRQLHGVTGNWIARISKLRAPSMKAVA